MNTADMPNPETAVDALKQCVDWLEYHKAQVHHPICTVHKPDARCSCGLHRVLTNLRGVISDMDEAQSALAGLVELLDAHGWGEGPALRAARAALAKGHS